MNDRCFLDTLWSQMTTEQPMLAKAGFVPLVRTGQFVDGAISNMDDVEAWNNLVGKHGEKKAREILKEGFRRMDERNLVNMETKGPPQ